MTIIFFIAALLKKAIFVEQNIFITTEFQIK